jgi:hypothetical protein
VIILKRLFLHPLFNIDKLGASGIVSSTIVTKFLLPKGVVDGEENFLLRLHFPSEIFSHCQSLLVSFCFEGLSNKQMQTEEGHIWLMEMQSVDS